LRFPRSVAVLTLLVIATLSITNTTAPGSLVPVGAVTLMTAPMATPIVVGRIALLPERRVAWGLVAAFVVFGAQLFAPTWSQTPAGLLGTLVPALIALYVDARRSLLRSLRDRADRAERERDLLAERAVFEERRRLATEMHDVVTHRLSLIVLHAGALGVTTTDDNAQRAAEEIRAAGRLALDELRDLLGVLRAEDEPATLPARKENQPLPDPAVLADESRSVGVPVELTVTGEPGQVSPTVARTAYRVVQEALTNVRKHAPGASVRAELVYRVAGVRVRVDNTAPAGLPDPALAGTGSGAGLVGLRHRVELVGGQLEAGPTAGAGWRVAAILPAYVPTGESAGHGQVGAG
ncbi:MAG TPA: histidine kinase, partial [Pseudonocardiaceae bacterium]|nr:histidine kinase [Pseudonocardiaceae bacterium]